MAKTRGGLDVSTINIGDTLYEYIRLIKDHWEGDIQYKTYHRCVVYKVIEMPINTHNDVWEIKCLRLSNQQYFTFVVDGDCLFAAAYLFNHKKWDALNWI